MKTKNFLKISSLHAGDMRRIKGGIVSPIEDPTTPIPKYGISYPIPKYGIPDPIPKYGIPDPMPKYGIPQDPDNLK